MQKEALCPMPSCNQPSVLGLFEPGQACRLTLFGGEGTVSGGMHLGQDSVGFSEVCTQTDCLQVGLAGVLGQLTCTAFPKLPYSQLLGHRATQLLQGSGSQAGVAGTVRSTISMQSTCDTGWSFQ